MRDGAKYIVTKQKDNIVFKPGSVGNKTVIFNYLLYLFLKFLNFICSCFENSVNTDLLSEAIRSRFDVPGFSSFWLDSFYFWGH